MKIGIDVSQLAYPNTGVAIFLEHWLSSLFASDKENEYVLFFSSLRGKLPAIVSEFASIPNVRVKTAKLPPTALDLLWNKTHKIGIEKFIGPVDLFITSDWTEPPAKAKKATIIYDLIVYKYPKETHEKIIATQKRKLDWVKKESDFVFTISESSKKDIEEILGLPSNKIKVIYPGL